jgi:UPF0716 family protein affecting phage T7 exclusion
MFGLGILGVLVGIGLLLFNTTHFALGVLGFLLMLVSVIGIVKSVRDRAAVGRSPSSMFRDAWRRAEERMRSRRRDQ